MAIMPKPTIKSTNIRASSMLTMLLLPLNSFQINTPQSAAIIGAPCPNA